MKRRTKTKKKPSRKLTLEQQRRRSFDEALRAVYAPAIKKYWASTRPLADYFGSAEVQCGLR